MSRKQITSIENWGRIIKNLNQINKCDTAIKHYLNKVHSGKEVRKLNRVRNTTRKQLKERFQYEHFQLSSNIFNIKGGGVFYYYEETNELIIKNEAPSKQHFDQHFQPDKEIDTVPEKHSDITSGMTKLDTEKGSDSPFESWKDLGQVMKDMREAYSNMHCGKLPKTSWNHDSLEKAIEELRSSLDSQMFDEHPDKATTDIFY